MEHLCQVRTKRDCVKLCRRKKMTYCAARNVHATLTGKKRRPLGDPYPMRSQSHLPHRRDSASRSYM